MTEFVWGSHLWCLPSVTAARRQILEPYIQNDHSSCFIKFLQIKSTFNLVYYYKFGFLALLHEFSRPNQIAVTTGVGPSQGNHRRSTNLQRTGERLAAFATSSLVIAGQKRAAIDVPDLDLPQGSRPVLGVKKGRHRQTCPLLSQIPFQFSYFA